MDLKIFLQNKSTRLLLQMTVPSFLASEDKVILVLVTWQRLSSSQFEGLGTKHSAEIQGSPGWPDVGLWFWTWIIFPESHDTYIVLMHLEKN